MNDELLNLLKSCKTQEEAMKIFQENKIELSDDDLEELKGGTMIPTMFYITPWGCASV